MLKAGVELLKNKRGVFPQTVAQTIGLKKVLNLLREGSGNLDNWHKYICLPKWCCKHQYISILWHMDQEEIIQMILKLSEHLLRLKRKNTCWIKCWIWFYQNQIIDWENQLIAASLQAFDQLKALIELQIDLKKTTCKNRRAGMKKWFFRRCVEENGALQPQKLICSSLQISVLVVQQVKSPPSTSS